jgi:hypothetical protein
MPMESVSFPDWKEALRQTALSESAKLEYAREIITFLKYLKDRHAAATTAAAKQYLEVGEPMGSGRWMLFRRGQMGSGR